MYSKNVKRGFLNPYPTTYKAIGEHIAQIDKIGLSVSSPTTIRNNPMHNIRLTNAVAGKARFFNRVFILVSDYYLFNVPRFVVR